MKQTRPERWSQIGKQIIYQANVAHGINHNKHQDMLYLFYTR